jgi:hypothetical protein
MVCCGLRPSLDVLDVSIFPLFLPQYIHLVVVAAAPTTCVLHGAFRSVSASSRPSLSLHGVGTSMNLICTKKAR